MDERELDGLICAGLAQRWQGWQAVVVCVDNTGARGTELCLYERGTGGWAREGGRWPAHAGKSGAFLMGMAGLKSAAAEEGATAFLARWLRYDLRPVLLRGSRDEIKRLMAEEWGMLCLPPAWCFIDDFVPDVKIDLRYNTEHNFTSRRVPGYLSSAAPLRLEALQALADAADELRAEGLGIRVFDAYRPQRATDAMVAWAEDTADTASKAEYYPGIDKKDIPGNYIALRSTHRMGGAVDLTLWDKRTGLDLDMGGPFDFFGELSAFSYRGIAPAQVENRARLRRAMLNHGFVPLAEEWWHFSYPVGGDGGDFDILPREYVI